MQAGLNFSLRTLAVDIVGVGPTGTQTSFWRAWVLEILTVSGQGFKFQISNFTIPPVTSHWSLRWLQNQIFANGNILYTATSILG